MSNGSKGTDEDSGLHDIRDLAASAKMRISRRIGTQPPPHEDADIASASAVMRAVALPQPARIVALGPLTEVPVATSQAATTAAAGASIPAFVAPTTATNNKKTLLVAGGIGAVVLAAAGIFFATRGGKHAAADDTSKLAGATPTAQTEPSKPTVEPITPTTAATAAGTAEPTPTEVAPTTPTPTTEPTTTNAAVKTDDKSAHAATKTDDKTADKGKPVETAATTTAKVDDKSKPTKPVEATATNSETPSERAAKEKDGGQPSLDELLGNSGGGAAKPEHDENAKKELSQADIKKAMGSVTGAAKACYDGTSGSVSVKLSVAPSGQVTKASAGGPLAGTKAADCVLAAVRSASFPSWDGAPMTVNYAFLLSE